MSSVIAILLLTAVAPEGTVSPDDPMALAADAADGIAPPACAGGHFRDFDFWLGEWDVYPFGKDEKIAESLIQRLHSGCAIRERWMPLKGEGGSSLSGFEPSTGQWHQTWIGSAPGRVEFNGGSEKPGTMVLTGWWPGAGGPGRDGWIRMEYTRQPDGSVRQRGKFWPMDGPAEGKAWEPSFDFLYRRKDGDCAGDCPQ